jgi:hypothetical protein
VRWERYASEHDSWEPEINLRDASVPLTNVDYMRSLGKDIRTIAADANKTAAAKHKKAREGLLTPCLLLRWRPGSGGMDGVVARQLRVICLFASVSMRDIAAMVLDTCLSVGLRDLYA